jgi:MinD-like ATPase involved in chromosome partitioning or flagellar assembly
MVSEGAQPMTEGDAILTPDHLYTWVDIDEYFGTLAVLGRWPSWLLEVDAYWDGVEVTVSDTTEMASVWQWLTERLGPLTVDAERQVILLESDDEAGDPLPVAIHVVKELPILERRLQWGERQIVSKLVDPLAPPDGEGFSHGVQICAFHSFKGGTGRTLHCLALARELVGRQHSRSAGRGRVLLVDADFEAPGITWMMAAQGNRIDIALKDFLALLHGIPTSDTSSAVALARKFLANQEIDGIIVLPATRDLVRLGPLQIEPADLLMDNRPRYFLTESLAELAHAVNADTVLVDLRAGTSELSAPILLDPRVHRVFVTTVSDQSVRGTVHLIREIARRAPSQRPTDPVCSVLITQFQEVEHSNHLVAITAELSEALSSTIGPLSGEGGDAVDDDTVDRDVVSQPLSSPFDPRLLALPARWGEVCDVIERTELRGVVAPIADALRPPARLMETPSNDALVAKRRALKDHAASLVYAENAEEDDFLSTEALINLVSKHRAEPPVEVIVGAKGSGKTFTYLRMCNQRSWVRFAEATGVTDVKLDVPIVPVLASLNLSNARRDEIANVQAESARRLTGGTAPSLLQLRDLIAEALDEELNDVAWRKVWLTCLARAAGLDATRDTAEQKLVALAREGRAIFVLDGLEDLFQEFSSNIHQQHALRSLLTSCPEWFRSLRGRPLGLVVFVRRDLVLNSIQQNTDQFLARHQAYELRWNRTEALRLVAWVYNRADALRGGGSASIRAASIQFLSDFLIQLWGQKLGADKSREARSEDWFIAALSDFNLQIQARDIISFLREASRNALELDERTASRWTDRLLPPTAMRRALPACSKEKIRAISDENPPVGKLFRLLRDVSSESRKVPFTLETVRLGAADARLLEANGVLFQEGDQYWIPEIYRHGLGFGVTGRPRVLAIAKQLRRRNDSL